MFEWDGNNWVKKSAINNEGYNNEGRFGRSVAISGDGNNIVSGGSYNDQTGPNTGYVRVFSKTLSQTLYCPIPLDITIHPSPTIDLGPDTTLICAGISETLDAGSSYDSYLWSDGSTNQTLLATTVEHTLLLEPMLMVVMLVIVW